MRCHLANKAWRTVIAAAAVEQPSRYMADQLQHKIKNQEKDMNKEKDVTDQVKGRKR